MRNQREDQLVFAVVLGLRREEVLQERNAAQNRQAAERFGQIMFHHAAEEVHFPFLQADLMLDLALSNDRLADATDVRLPRYRRNIKTDFQTDLAPRVNPGCDIDVDADVEILKLRVDQRVSADAPDA